MNAPIPRPQRTLTDAEWDTVSRTKLLTLHGALYMGIVDPVPNPSPMPEPEGAWVREHVWPDWIHEIDSKYPFGFWRWSTCERGTCWNCLNHRCDLCVHRQRGGPHVDDNRDSVHNQHGRHIATLILRPGGEPCVWWCRCPCPKPPPAPAAPPPQPQAAPAARLQDTLFDLEQTR
ncbi:DUF6248 family natural product biosynthesis protein [Streptomyces sp. G1]|uniref:DUF6248 family natural product biosynthesis protein n=1 Tax=Streptomyces sp. G1 TaxID=361572 RepID=UPI00202E99C8|nr:DUF6248 family natural product biosynthesis protein [Streptomyces sp. G1]MCM1972295.1 DUF6248 family natural product biosynthesis protein [Streptomyces sp. G1]